MPLVKLIGGPFDGAEYALIHDDTKEIHMPVPEKVGRRGFDAVKYFRRSRGVYVWEGIKEAAKK